MNVKVKINFNYKEYGYFFIPYRREEVLEKEIVIPNDVFDDLKNRRISGLEIYPDFSIGNIFIIWSNHENIYVLLSNRYYENQINEYYEDITSLIDDGWDNKGD